MNLQHTKHFITKLLNYNTPPIIVLILLFGVFLTSCHTSEPEKHEETSFLVTSPLKIDTTFTKEYVCKIQAVQHIELRALEKGYLQDIHVNEGQFVKKGQPMFGIMPALYEAELQKAQAEVKFAEIEYQNTKQLTDSNIVSANELALYKAKYDKAKAELALSQVHLNFTKVAAPFDGIMDRIRVRRGSLIDEGELLTTLADNSSVWAYFNVTEAEYLDLNTNIRGDNAIPVKLLMANQQVFKHPGKVTTIEADFNNETGNIAFRATFPNPEGLLRHGETGNILLSVPLKDALLIPQKATFEVLDKKYVYVIDKDHIVKTRRIVVGEELPHVYVVQEGLEVGDKILLEGLRKVRELDEIQYEFVEPDSAISELALYAE